MAPNSSSLAGGGSNTQTIPASPFPFAACDDKGNPVEFRLSTVNTSRDTWQIARNEEHLEVIRRARIRKLYDGWLPFDPERIKNSGFKDKTNVNFMGLRGAIEGRVGQILSLAVDTLPLVELRSLTPASDGTDVPRILQKIETEFSTTLREHSTFIHTLAHMVRETELYGLGPVTWNSPFSYLPVGLERGNIKFPARSRAFSSEAELIMVELDLDAGYFFNLLRDEANAKRLGWDTDMLKRLVVAVFVYGLRTNAESSSENALPTWESAIARYRENRAFDTDQFRTISVVIDYVKETSDGKISMSIRTGLPFSSLPDTDHGKALANQLPETFLFRKKAAFDTMDQCLIWLPGTATETRARALRGMATYLYPVEDMNNKFMCSLYDAAKFQLAVPVQAQNPNQRDISMNPVGPLMLMDATLKPFQMQKTSQDIQTLAGIRELGSAVAMNNVTGLRGTAAAPERISGGGDRKTQEQVTSENIARRDTDLATFAMRVTVLDKVFRETFRRFVNIVKAPSLWVQHPEVRNFVDRMEGHNIPRDVLNEVLKNCDAMMNRSLAYGNGRDKAGVLTGVLSNFGGTLDEAGRKMLVKDILGSSIGDHASDRYIPEMSRDMMQSDATSLATLENNSIRGLAQVSVGADQMHWSHIPIHSQIVSEIANAVQSGQVTEGAQQMMDILEMATNHIREHLQFGRAQTGMEPKAKELEKNIQSLAPMIKNLTMLAANEQKTKDAAEQQKREEYEALQKQADANQIAPKMRQVELDHEVKLRAADLDYQARMAALERDTDIRTRQGEMEAARLQSQGQNKLQIDRSAAIADAGLKRQQAMHEQLLRLQQGNQVLGRQAPQPNIAGTAGAPPAPAPSAAPTGVPPAIDPATVAALYERE